MRGFALGLVLLAGAALAQRDPGSLRFTQPVNASSGPFASNGDLTVHGDAGIGGSVTIRGGGTAPLFASTPKSGIDLNNGSGSTPGIRLLTGANTNLALDVVGNQIRIGRNFGEAGGTVLWRFDGPTGNLAAESNGTHVDLGTGAFDFLRSDGTDIRTGTSLLPPSSGGANLGASAVPWANGFFAGLVHSDAASGSNAFAVLTNGARIDLGTGASDYWESDGTKIATPGSVAVSGEISTTYVHVGDSIRNVNAAPLTVIDAEGLAILGVATVGLAACNATAPPTGTRGTIQYDTTTNTLKACNGTRYVEHRGTLRGSATLDFASIAAASYIDHPTTIAVTGAVQGQACTVGTFEVSWVAGVDFSCRVSSNGVVTVRAHCNNGTVGTCDPASSVFTVDVTQ